MKLDNLEHFATLDAMGMLREIDQLPDQLQKAWDLGLQQTLADISGVKHVLVAGMGGSAIGGDLLAAYAAPLASVPIMLWRDYDLPGYVVGPDTLVIVSSHSGNTEEALSSFARGIEVNAQMLVVTTGGELARQAEKHGVPLWRFEHGGQPRAAVGYSFGLLLAAATRLGLLPDQEDALVDAVEAMRDQQEALQADVPVVQNSAKRMAGQLVGRMPTIVGSGMLAPVARRWRTQIAELSKALAQFEYIPEADHNMVAGVLNPDELFPATMVVFLRAASQHPRNLLRIDTTKMILMVEGFNTDLVEARGEERLAQQWTSLHFGDYTAYYLAMVYGVDPTPVAAIEDLKRQIKVA
jgi:glucose/mannose-6-phosphate isomerase